MKITLIRHAMTYGNTLKRYIGVTDEEVCSEGMKQLKKMVQAGYYPDCEIVFASPMLRCRQTAEIIYPHHQMVYENDFRECDFGSLEGKNYEELKGDTAYQRWIDSGGTLPFPGGEDIDEFKKRCRRGFRRVIAQCLWAGSPIAHQMGYDSKLKRIRDPQNTGIALVVHGGTIMSIMETFEENHKNYYEYHVENCEGYETVYNGRDLKIVRKIQMPENP
ncbi:MAG: histidine phosphatase family protein [Lachnospiraceae bacterium]|nr:histidine phosphatase family protein [Lachnospiraceae bacterium]